MADPRPVELALRQVKGIGGDPSCLLREVEPLLSLLKPVLGRLTAGDIVEQDLEHSTLGLEGGLLLAQTLELSLDLGDSQGQVIAHRPSSHTIALPQAR
jgi:hypothetical protein